MSPFRNALFSTLVLFFLIGCTSADDSSKLMISFPKSTSSSMNVAQSVSPMSTSDDDEDWNASLNPTAISQVNCYGVMVGGSEAGMSHNWVHNENDQVAFKFGPWIAAIPEGKQAVLEVPSGSSRTITILGWQATNSSCERFRVEDPDYEPDFQSMSYPYVVGQVTTDLEPGDVELDIRISMTGAFPVYKFKGKDFEGHGGSGGDGPGNSAGSLFGDERDGDLTISASQNLNTYTYDLQTTSGGQSSSTTKYFNKSVIVNGISADGRTLNTSVAISNNHFEPGDEVFWHIFAGNVTSGSPDSDACGGIPRGAWGFGHVASTSASSVTLEHEIDPQADYSALNTGLSASSPFTYGYHFCRMHITRVPNFKTLTISGGGNFNVNTSSFLNGGGLVVFRAKTLDIGATTNIDVSGRGFMGTASLGGAGIGGEGSGTAGITNENGGAYYTGSGGGGGSAAGSGGMGFDASANPGQSVDYCNGPCFIVNEHKMMFGGAGGADSATAGGNGGGAIFIHAETISGAGTLNLKANGNDSTNGGGGAGGAIHLTVSNAVNSAINSEAYGGFGGSNGGGGAGGIVEIPYCSAQSTASIGMPTTDGGGGYTGGESGTYITNDEPGLCTGP